MKGLFALLAVLPAALSTSVPSKEDSCKSTDFWWSEKSCCLPKGGIPSPPAPPEDTSCPPTNYYWHSEKSCCVPRNLPPANPPAPTCSAGWTWNPDDFKCTPTPTPTPTPSSCKKTEFWWDEKDCCLPNGGIPSPPSPPTGSSCPPSGYYWHTEKSCCVPRTPPPANPPAPTCSAGWTWISDLFSCTPTPTPSPPSTTCKKTEFWWDVKGCCLPNGGIPSPPAPPTGTTCPPTGYYWHSEKSCCVPRTPPPANPPTPTCSANWTWDADLFKCTPTPTTPSPSTCKSTEFWWGEKNCCLPHGGIPTPPPPPKGSDCPPTSYYWHTGKGCCVPRNPPPPNPPAPQCPQNWTWYPNLWKCIPTPTPPTPPPSNPSPKPGSKPPTSHSRRRDHKARITLCPTGLDACPVSGLLGEYECVDTATELEFCGGCAAESGKGQNCTKIEGAWNVACEQGSCVVLTCAGGFTISDDGSSCVEA